MSKLKGPATKRIDLHVTESQYNYLKGLGVTETIRFLIDRAMTSQLTSSQAAQPVTPSYVKPVPESIIEREWLVEWNNFTGLKAEAKRACKTDEERAQVDVEYVEKKREILSRKPAGIV